MKRLAVLSISIFYLLIVQAVLRSTELPDGKLSGFIKDKSSGLPIPDANIIIEGTKYGTVSKVGGFYFLENIPKTISTITVRVMGYQTKTSENITITSNTVLNFSLIPEPIQTESVIITATRTDHLQSNVTMSSEVISHSQLQTKNGSTVGEIVQSATGTFTKNYGSLAGIQTASIRGSNVDQVLVLLDNRRLNNAQGGGVDLNNLPIEGIDRIEILRGGHSALYGSDAIGGIINLITRQTRSPKGFSYGMKTSVGSYGFENYNLFGSHQIGRLSYFLSYNRLQNKGNYGFSIPGSTEKIDRENNDYLGNSLFAKMQLFINQKNYLQFIHQSIKTKRGVIGPISFPSPKARREETRRFYTLKTINQISNRIRIEGQLYYQTTNNDYHDPGGWVSTEDTHKSFTQGFDFQTYVAILPQIVLTAGTEFEEEKLESTKFPEKERTKQSVFVQTEWDKSFFFFGVDSKFRLIPAVRWDKYTDFDAQTSPKIGALFSVGDHFIFRGNAGKSFRVPAFFDLYWPEDDYTKGNPNLLPEQSTDFDFGILVREAGNQHLQLESTYFQNDFDDLILWKSDTDWKWAPFNVGQAKISGLENSVFYRFPKNFAHVKIAYTKMKAIDNTSESANKDKRLTYRPDEKLDLSAGLQFNPITANIGYSLVGKRFTKDDNSEGLPGYRLVNGNVGSSFSINNITLDAKFEILNLLDKNIYILKGYPIPGREFRFSVGLKY
jgi:outer membrane receptor for ferrienterochelin and colicins